jgi:hypothetical protein
LGHCSPTNLQYSLQHSLEIAQNLVVPKPQNRKSLSAQPAVAPGVIIQRIGMLTTVRLNDAAGFKTNKIDDIWPQWLLTAELVALKSVRPQMAPQESLVLGGILTELSSITGIHPDLAGLSDSMSVMGCVGEAMKPWCS